MEAFCKLADARRYVACDWDLSRDEAGRRHWVAFFNRHVETILGLGIGCVEARGGDVGEARVRAEACKREFWEQFDRFGERPGDCGRVTILTLDQWRDGLLRKYGFADAFADLKDRENAKMLPLLPGVCAEVDAISGEAEQLRAVVEGVFAGNIFDMGAEATAKRFLGGGPDFFETRGGLKKRPWLVDDYDKFEERSRSRKRHKRAVFFIDNAGSDFLLGAVVMIRWLARRGTAVVAAANERPTLNDMTIADVRAWWPRVVEAEPSLRGLPIEFVSTGTGEPLIDLSCVSEELNEASRDADLVILEGMGRGVESNLDAAFSCDALNLAMIKDEVIARRLGGQVFDCVCRFR